MTPRYKGSAEDWKRTTGLVVGDSEGRQWITVPFEGPSDEIRSFRSTWEPGSSCPVAGFTHLLLKERPQCRERGPVAYSTLRFEGPDEGGDGSNGHSSVTSSERFEERSFKIESNTADNSGVFGFHASVVDVSYIADSRQTTTSYDSKLNLLVDPEPSVTHSKGSALPFHDSLVLNTHYHVTEWHVIASQGERGDTWEVTEYHAKYLTPGALPDAD